MSPFSTNHLAIADRDELACTQMLLAEYMKGYVTVRGRRLCAVVSEGRRVCRKNVEWIICPHSVFARNVISY
eukprot:scaffold41748_cov31-Tisochrysis_lutea.AAC.1